ncbi:GlxA family transcriptional regulator [Rhodovulum sp. FJ3]|uniref:GlxA family transcriptional regulator n=1 Tax=Rhodovulum sp. FJ3 TaxID=3079053 RepID=UPI00293DBB08|nr:GlxA family transcriptional regulator [Rhodovulum sp. FJ3]MDV4167425.1 GlxA family transcriptional regulator [Rhodovulum sp. FJ3]
MQRIGFVLIDGFALLSTAAAMEPLRAANLFAPKPLYDLVPLSTSGGWVGASLGAGFQTTRLRDAGALDMVFVVAGGDPMALRDPDLMTWLRDMDRRGVPLGGISGGAAVLARAGVMDQRRFTVHWHHLDQVRALSDRFVVEQRLYVIDRDRLTCAGGAAPLDMMYAMIRADHGAPLARQISDWFIQTDIRLPDAPQQAGIGAQFGPLPRAVEDALDLMHSHLSDPLARDQIADLVGLSTRQLQRLFDAHIGKGLMATYRDLRLRAADDILRKTVLPVADVAQMTGFGSAPAFATAYRTRFGHPPRDARKTQNGGPNSDRRNRT